MRRAALKTIPSTILIFVVLVFAYFDFGVIKRIDCTLNEE